MAVQMDQTLVAMPEVGNYDYSGHSLSLHTDSLAPVVELPLHSRLLHLPLQNQHHEGVSLIVFPSPSS